VSLSSFLLASPAAFICDKRFSRRSHSQSELGFHTHVHPPNGNQRIFQVASAEQTLRSSGRTTLETLPMPKEPKMLDALFHDTLRDIYYAEKKILTALPKMAKAAQSDDLRAAFEKHEGETEGQVSRLEKIFGMIDKKPQGKKCPAIDGIIEEGQEISKDYKGSPALDAGLLSAAQSVEHYEISRYGTLRAWATELGLDEAAQLLKETLDEESATDKALTELAESLVNQEAQQEAA
jgi:ferritin-like metal-binding protein YciE